MTARPPGLRLARLLRLCTCALTIVGFHSILHAASASAGPLSGRVVDPDGRPVVNARVLVSGPTGVVETTTGSAGDFAVADLPPASYVVSVQRDGLVSDPIEVRLDGAGRDDLLIRLHMAPLTEAVVVSAAQVSQPLSRLPTATTVIERDEVQARQLEVVSDALRTVPGLTVSRNGGRGALTSVFPRGGDSDYTLVMVNGIRQNAFGGGFDFSLLPFGDVEQVEVVRGPQSAVYGSDAIGSIVHVTTRRAERRSVAAQLEGGGQGTVRALGALRGAIDELAFGASAEHAHSDGFTGTAPATGEIVSNDDWRSTNVLAHLDWTRGPSTGVAAYAAWTEDERGNPGPYGSNPVGAYTAVDRVSRGANDRRQLAVDARLPWGRRLSGRVQQRLQATAADFDSTFRSPFGDSFSESRRLTGRAQTDILASATTGVSFGLEALAETARNTFITGELSQEVPVERRTVGYFAEVRQELGPRASIISGVRLEQIRRAALEGNPSEFSPRPPFAADTVLSANPRVAATFVVWQDGRGRSRTRLRASGGTGIRPPDAFEIAFTDNPGLKPERSRSADVGILHDLTATVAVEGTVFYNRYDDVIVAVGRSFEDASRYRTDNISNARARGLELAGSWRSRVGLVARATYTWLDSAILAVDHGSTAPQPLAVGDPLLRRPRHQGTLTLIWSASAVTAFGEVRSRGEVLDVEPSFGASGGLFTAPGYTVADAGATWRIRAGLHVFARVLNLLDRDYEEAFGFPAQRRTGMVGVRLALGS
jgi:outer membrane cobalamin receptor